LDRAWQSLVWTSFARKRRYRNISPGEIGNVRLRTTRSFEFFLCGTNPGTNTDFTTEQAYVTANINVNYWFGWKIVFHETNAFQFCQAVQQQSGYCSDPNNWGWPVFGKPAGYGIMQVDPVTSQAPFWDWTAAVQAAATRLRTLSGQRR